MNKKLFILVLLVVLLLSFSSVYGEKGDIEEKAYDLGYDKGWDSGKKYAGEPGESLDEIEIPKGIIPNKNRIKSHFKQVYEDIYNTKYDEDIVDYYLEGFEHGFEDAVRYGKASGSDGEKLNYSQSLGRTLGGIYAHQDHSEGKNSNWRRAIPSDRQIRTMYNLSRETSQYRTEFIRSFKLAFESGYKEGYERANLGPVRTAYDEGLNHGADIGQMKGEYAAILDVSLGRSNIWSRHQVGDHMIIEDYGLDYQVEEYRTAFITGYWQAFIEAYEETHRGLHMEDNRTKTHREIISIDGKANIAIAGDDKFLVDIEAGAYYRDVVVTIDSIPMSYIFASTPRYTQVSEIYGLQIINPLFNIHDDSKTINVKLKSYGKDDKYGIYKYDRNKWVYIPSRQEGNYLVAELKPSEINPDGNIFTVRIDSQFVNFYDARGHWAKEEIDIYVKREIINGYPDGTFKPSNEISRREFITMLSRFYDWYPPYDSANVKKFKDYKDFGYGEKPISYAISHGFINGYGDNTFRPNDPISFKEVEQVMGRILGNKNFNWNNYAKELMYERGFRSKSFNGKNNKISRGEFLYMLHRLNK